MCQQNDKQRHFKIIYLKVDEVLDHVFIPEETVIHLSQRVTIIIIQMQGFFFLFQPAVRCVSLRTCFQRGKPDLSESP